MLKAFLRLLDRFSDRRNCRWVLWCQSHSVAAPLFLTRVSISWLSFDRAVGLPTSMQKKNSLSHGWLREKKSSSCAESLAYEFSEQCEGACYRSHHNARRGTTKIKVRAW